MEIPSGCTFQRRCSRVLAVKAKEDALRLSTNLATTAAASLTLTLSACSGELVLSFFLGSSLALFLAIGVLLALPEKSPAAQ